MKSSMPASLAFLSSFTFAYDTCRSAACYNAIIDQDLGPEVGYVPASHENDCISFMGASTTYTETGATSATSIEEVGYTDTATVLTYQATPTPTPVAAPRFRNRGRGLSFSTPTPSIALNLPRTPDPSPNGIPDYAASACPASSDYSAACSCAGITATTSTVPYSTTTTVTTSTWTEDSWPTARVTTTKAACVAAEDYGLQKGSVDVNNYYVADLPAPVTALPGRLSKRDCCEACFASEDDGCVWWAFDEGNSTSTCSLSVADGGARCPQGPGHSEAKLNPNGDLMVGFGPCVQEVDVFIQY